MGLFQASGNYLLQWIKVTEVDDSLYDILADSYKDDVIQKKVFVVRVKIRLANSNFVN